MTNSNDSPCSPALVESFYQAYNDTTGSQQDRLVRCEAILDAVRACSRMEPGYYAWSLLFQGILANERARDWGAGERLFRAALASNQGHDPLLEARAALALGVTCHTLDRWAESLAFCRQALAALAGLDKPIDVAAAWTNMAIACSAGFTAGAFGASAVDDGIAYCHHALATLDAMAPTRERSSLQASVYNTLGSLHSHASQWHDAIAAYQRHLAICQEAGYTCRTGISYDNLGQVYEQMGAAYAGQASESYQAALRIHAACNDPYREALAGLSWAGLLDAQGDKAPALAQYLHAIDQLEGLRAGISTAEARAGFSASIATAYAHAVLLAVALGDVAQAFDLAERSRARAFLDSLAAGQAELLREQVAERITLADVQQSLEPEALLLAYYTTGALDPPARSVRRTAVQRHHFPPPHTLLFAVTRQRITLHDTSLSPNDLLPRQLHGVSERHFLQPSVRHALYDHLLGPIAGLLPGKNRLLIVPHGPLHYVPFQALIDRNGETLLHAAGPALVYGPSASVLLRAPREVAAAPRIGVPCLALGYNGTAPFRLRFAEEEAGHVAALCGGEARLGPSGKWEALSQLGSGARYLHISCHGEFDPEDALASRLHLGAGATLTAREILDGWRFTGDLVVLSACESGLSRVRRGDELMGLVRAFMVAGAPAVVATLWRVDERSTRLLMERFYREVAAGASFAPALQRAQVFLRELTAEDAQRLLAADAGGPSGDAPPTSIADLPTSGGDTYPFADPFFWAPFILVGVARDRAA